MSIALSHPAIPPPFSRLVTTSPRDRADKAEKPGWEGAQPVAGD